MFVLFMTACLAIQTADPAHAADDVTPPLSNTALHDAPMYVDSRAIEERFSTITSEDMEMLRGKKILVIGQSHSMLLAGGLRLLAQQDPKYQFLSPDYKIVDYDNSTDTKLTPEELAYKHGNFLHVKIVYPQLFRYEQLNTLVRGPLGDTLDVAFIWEHVNCSREEFELNAKTFDKLQAEFPNIRFIVTTGISVPNAITGTRKGGDWMNMDSHGFATEMRDRYWGKVPFWDLQRMLNDDFRYGYGTATHYCPSYTDDPNDLDLHPSKPAGLLVTAKGFLLVLRDALKATPWPPAAPGPVKPGNRQYAPKTVEPIDADHPDAKAVRAILDANGLKEKKIEDVAIVRNGRVTKLFLMGIGMETIPAAIGELSELRDLTAYGLPGLTLLRTLDPAISKCAKLEMLILADNDLTALPETLVDLENLHTFSLAGNRLHDLSPALNDLTKRLDPRGMANQRDK